MALFVVWLVSSGSSKRGVKTSCTVALDCWEEEFKRPEGEGPSGGSKLLGMLTELTS